MRTTVLAPDRRGPFRDSYNTRRARRLGASTSVQLAEPIDTRTFMGEQLEDVRSRVVRACLTSLDNGQPYGAEVAQNATPFSGDR